jgi:hypothetical protein
MITIFQPDLVILDLPNDSRRSTRVRNLVEALASLCAKKAIRTKSYSRSAVQKALLGEGSTKHQIATMIAARFPELAPKLPPFRKPWMSEDPRMSIFNAVGLTLTFYEKESNPLRYPSRSLKPSDSDMIDTRIDS